MGFRLLDLKLSADFTTEELAQKIRKKLKITQCTYTIEKQSLDARKKPDISWILRVGVYSPELKGGKEIKEEPLHIPFQKRNQKVVVVGSGPAGFFSAYALLKAGFQVTILERGPEVEQRLKDITHFERTGDLNERSNYAFGEGGAGTFSDGKLTSRTKTISKEKRFIIDTYIEAGAPKEIAWLSKPHLGSDNLRKMVKRLRETFVSKGGQFVFGEKVTHLCLREKKVVAVETENQSFQADFAIYATGHSSYDTYRMLMDRGIKFEVKPFAIGTRVEHPQQLINQAQWGRVKLEGVKAAEYNLSYKNPEFPVYSFCMCPGGQVVPSSAYKGLNIVNGKSNYQRNSPFANSAIVAGLNLQELLNREVSPPEALEWLTHLERTFYDHSKSYKAPACKVGDFIRGKVSDTFGKSSYPLGLEAADFQELLPQKLYWSIQKGLQDFCRKIKGFEKGIIMGLESKTSSPVRVLRDEKGRCQGMENLYFAGEGSGYAGGIISSAADGIKAAFHILSTK